MFLSQGSTEGFLRQREVVVRLRLLDSQEEFLGVREWFLFKKGEDWHEEEGDHRGVADVLLGLGAYLLQQFCDLRIIEC